MCYLWNKAQQKCKPKGCHVTNFIKSFVGSLYNVQAMQKLIFGHLGLKSIKSVVKTKTIEQAVLTQLDRYYDGQQHWNSKTPLSAKEKLILSLATLRQQTLADGILIINTQRNNNQYWDDKNIWNEIGGCTIVWEPSLCPTKESFQLLNQTSLGFDKYVQSYMESLHDHQGIQKAIALIRFANSQNSVPLFTCGDPYFPDFFDGDKINDVWLNAPSLRTHLCHRYILVQEILNYCQENRLLTEVYEVDINDCSIKKW